MYGLGQRFPLRNFLRKSWLRFLGCFPEFPATDKPDKPVAPASSLDTRFLARAVLMSLLKNKSAISAPSPAFQASLFGSIATQEGIHVSPQSLVATVGSQSKAEEAQCSFLGHTSSPSSHENVDLPTVRI